MNILCIYNAKSGKLNGILDIAHKIISPKSYPCNLCAMTHDTFSENDLWKEFKKNTSLSLEFLHSDEFEQQFSQEKFRYPIILLKNDQKVTEWISKETIEKNRNNNGVD
ncbi:hypothetical protein KORDIASMS9_02016 [Kordia sp. SMS9]|uniref:GTPase n=1 Tax=Kordia sp. SMS9 TaxID=2282170 RepID=UPI000E0DC408|nr:GTPase [Kordia sp. SMS9]AXG69789.1 hypothetical protein KORDIASMS9_02016 [Kordia sp. SMS9]